MQYHTQSYNDCTRTHEYVYVCLLSVAETKETGELGDGEEREGSEGSEGGERGEKGGVESGQRLMLEEQTCLEEERQAMEGSEVGDAALTRPYAGKPLPLNELLPKPYLSPTAELNKYWNQRYRLFSRYDNGICLDRGMTSL